MYTKFHKKFTAKKAYEGRMEPFRVIGNVYFVGTYQASSHLIDTGEGLILIDTGYASSLYLVLESIWELGFDPRDIKYIINSHWHGDHTEATEALAKLSGAKTLLGREYESYVLQKEYFVPDILVDEGYELSLGNTVIRFLHTPGHTKGTISLFFDVNVDGTTYRVGMFGGAGANSLEKNYSTYYEGCREDYRNSVERLRGEKVDVFIGNHCWNNQTEIRGALVKQGGENPFIDGEIWGEFLDYCMVRLEHLLKKEADAATLSTNRS